MREKTYIFDFENRDKAKLKNQVSSLSFITGVYLKEYRGPDIETITVPEGYEIIGQSAFNKNKNLKTLILPDSVVKIDEMAFAYMKTLEKIVLSKNIKKISTEAFRSCTNLKEVVLPINLESIGRKAFFGCTSLEKILLPNTLRYIDTGAFHNCSSLRKINIPYNVKYIWQGTFSFSGIEKIEISNHELFEYKNGLLIEKSVNEHKRIIWANPNIAKHSYVIPDDITAIGEGAFNGCRELSMLHIHDKITSISNNRWSERTTFYCRRDSYGHKYATFHNIKTVLK